MTYQMKMIRSRLEMQRNERKINENNYDWKKMKIRSSLLKCRGIKDKLEVEEYDLLNEDEKVEVVEMQRSER